MASQTGRTVKDWTRFVVDDSAGTLREIPVDSINGIGLDYPEEDLTAWQDIIQGILTSTPDAVVEVGGPFDTSAAQAVAASGAQPALSGSHTVLYNLAGRMTPLSLGVYIGIRHFWETGEPTWGVSSSATSGFVCTSYQVEGNKYKARFRMYPGSSAPAWGTAAVT